MRIAPSRRRPVGASGRAAGMLLILLGRGVGAGGEPGPAPEVVFTDVVPVAGGRNLVPNGSFEAGAVGWASLGRGVGEGNHWAPLAGGWGNLSGLHGTIGRGDADHGRAFLRIRLGGRHTPELAFDYFHPVRHRELRPLAASRGWIPVMPGRSYTLSLSLRASRDGIPGALGLVTEDPAAGWPGARTELLHRVVLGTGWRRYQRTFVPTHPYAFVLGGPDLAAEEDAWVDVDSVQLEPGSPATDFAPRAPFEIGVMPAAPAGVYTRGEPAALRIAAANAGDRPVYARFSFRATDYHDQRVELTDADLEVAPRSAAEKLVPLPRHWRGFYRVVATCRYDGLTIESRPLRLAIVPPRTTPETILGVNHAFATADLVELARRAGVTWYRDWSLKWQHIEPERGRFRWDLSDPQFGRLTAQGLDVVGLIPFPATDWNSTAPDLAELRQRSPRYAAGGTGGDAELLQRARWAWMPRDPAELAGFVQAVVRRYADRIRTWEILNEPLYTLYALPNAKALRSAELQAHTVDDYLGLLRVTAAAARAADPRARIIAGGAAPDSPVVHDLIAAGVLREADILGLHDYPAAPARRGAEVSPPESLLPELDKLRDAMRAHGGQKPIWLTEFSYYGGDDPPRRPFQPIPELWSEPQLLSEKEAADFTIRYVTIFAARGGERIFLHSGSTGSVNRPGTESCLFAEGAVRKAYAALAVFTELLGGQPRFVADRQDGSSLAFAFEAGPHALLVLWDPKGGTTVAVPAGVDCRDAMGHPILDERVRLSGSPVYWVGPSGSAGRLLSAGAFSPPAAGRTDTRRPIARPIPSPEVEF